jgi:hypothetical protein
MVIEASEMGFPSAVVTLPHMTLWPVSPVLADPAASRFG